MARPSLSAGVSLFNDDGRGGFLFSEGFAENRVLLKPGTPHVKMPLFTECVFRLWPSLSYSANRALIKLDAEHASRRGGGGGGGGGGGTWRCASL